MRMRGVYQPRPDGEKIDLTNLPKGGTSVIPPPRRYAERIEPEQPGLEADREALRELRRCEAWPVIGCEGMVDVRMPQSLWAHIQAAMGN